MPHVVVVFSGPVAAEFLVAGLPAAARVAIALSTLKARNGVDSCSIVADGWIPSGTAIEECRRLAPALDLDFDDRRPGGQVLVVGGEAFVCALSRAEDSERDSVLSALLEAWTRPRPPSRPAASDERSKLAELRRAGRRFLAATGKPGDGIVSRYLNRPVSRAISGALLAVPGITPVHASAGTALLAAAMFICLVLGGGSGLMAGALLFQAASIFDGVDGEIARATHRTSRRGAMLDSVIDALTNLAFVAGVAINLGLRGDLTGTAAGICALVTLATGLLLIGGRADARGEPVNFEGIKRHFRARGKASFVMECLIVLTMRDFFAAACTVMVLLGLAHEMLLAFAIVALGWLLVTAMVLARGRPASTFRAIRAGRHSPRIASRPTHEAVTPAATLVRAVVHDV